MIGGDECAARYHQPVDASEQVDESMQSDIYFDALPQRVPAFVDQVESGRAGPGPKTDRASLHERRGDLSDHVGADEGWGLTISGRAALGSSSGKEPMG